MSYSYEFQNTVHIDEVQNSITFIYNLKKQWKNKYLTYKDLKKKTPNTILEDREIIWFPWVVTSNIENSKKCVRTDIPEILEVKINENSQYTRSPLTELNNAFLFSGSENPIFQEWSWTCEFLCQFDYRWYPFDTQNCPIILNYTNQLDIHFHSKYVGPIDLVRYYFHASSYCKIDKNGRDGLFIDFIFKRPVLNNLITLFLPTSMLLLISQLSTAFSKTFKEMVIEVNTTLLLVLTTLLVKQCFI